MFCQSSKNLVCSNGLQSSKIGWQPAQNRWILWKESVQLNEYDTEGRLIRESTPELLYRLSCTYDRAGNRDGREEQFRTDWDIMDRWQRVWQDSTTWGHVTIMRHLAGSRRKMWSIMMDWICMRTVAVIRWCIVIRVDLQRIY